MMEHVRTCEDKSKTISYVPKSDKQNRQDCHELDIVESVIVEEVAYEAIVYSQAISNTQKVEHCDIEK